MQRKAESARQNSVAVADLHESQSFDAIKEDEGEEDQDLKVLLSCVLSYWGSIGETLKHGFMGLVMKWFIVYVLGVAVRVYLGGPRRSMCLPMGG